MTGEPSVFGALVIREPRIYHRPVAGRGRQTLAYLSDMNWYEDQDHRRLRAVMERLGEISADPDVRRLVYKDTHP